MPFKVHKQIIDTFKSCILAVRHFSVHCFGSVSHKKHLMKSVTFVGNVSSVNVTMTTDTGKRLKTQQKQPHALRSSAKN